MEGLRMKIRGTQLRTLFLTLFILSMSGMCVLVFAARGSSGATHPRMNALFILALLLLLALALGVVSVASVWRAFRNNKTEDPEDLFP
jgi:hypothetical protein